MSRVILVFALLCVLVCRGAHLNRPLKIVNGQLADIKDFPYMVSLQYNGTFFGHDYDHFCCGGIIADKWIITSAQCAQARDTDNFHVRVGSTKYYEDGVVYKVAKTLTHPNFNQLSYDYDVALLQLTERIEFGRNVKALSLPKNSQSIEANAELSIAGWGATQLLGPISDDLRGSHIQKISDKNCQTIYGLDSVTDRMFCVFSKGFGPCVGDSGSPAVYNNQIIGVASWSYGCAYENPTVYARISTVQDWIIGATNDDDDDDTSR